MIYILLNIVLPQKVVQKYVFYLVDCTWDAWVIGQCSTTCGGGIQTDNREKYQEELYGGNPCEGNSTRQTVCNTNACPGIQMI